MPRPRRAGDMQTIDLICATSYRGVGFKVLWAQALSGLKAHEHMRRIELGPSIGWSRT
jgi:hypothetical protein